MEKLLQYGYIPTADTQSYQVARVTAVHRERYEVICEEGFAYARLKSSVYFANNERSDNITGTAEYPTVGDFVLIHYNDIGDSTIIRTLERKSYFARKDPSSKLHKSESSDTFQAVAANFDYVFILSSLNHDLNIGRLERYLTLSWQSQAIPVIILTKADIEEDNEELVREVEKIAGDALIYKISSKTGAGLTQLAEYLEPKKTIVLLGSSGVGKSSLVNALAGKEIMKVNDIRDDDSKGRHTTTHRQLIQLDNGVMIIDTPGMRELGMWDVTEGIGEAFADIEQYMGKCKFNNCTHKNEPGCAIMEAIEDGELSTERWESYNKLKKEARYSDNKVAYSNMDKKAGKQFSKWNKQRKKAGKQDF